MVNLVVIYAKAFVVKVTCYLAGTPTVSLTQLHNLDFHWVVDKNASWTALRLFF
jgi:hypothetical protein